MARLIVRIIGLGIFFAAASAFAQEPTNDMNTEQYGPEGAVVETASDDGNGNEQRQDWDSWSDVETFQDLKKNDSLDF